MSDLIVDFYETTSIIDLIYLVLTILSLIKCYNNGFILSILSMAKWLFAYIITLLIFPKVKPYLEGIIDNEYVLDIGLGIAIFIVVIFLVLMINRGLSRAIRYTVIGSLDTIFGFFFCFIKAYIVSLCIFSVIHIIYNYDNWSINIDKLFIYTYLEKSSNYLLKEILNEKTYQNSKEKIEEL